MTSSSTKLLHEQEIFRRFTKCLGTEMEWLSVESRNPPEPDLLCTHSVLGSIAFELVSLTDPVIAKIQDGGSKANQSVFSTSDPSSRIVREKLHKKYVIDKNYIELLVYSEGRLITPDDVIIPTILPLFNSIPHTFKRVWFMGEVKTCCLWSSS